MLNQKITVLVQSMVGGPAGKLKPGQVVELEDSPYVRVLIKSGAVALVDPPSLDDDYLEKAGYLTKETHNEEPMLTKASKKANKAESGEIVPENKVQSTPVDPELPELRNSESYSPGATEPKNRN